MVVPEYRTVQALVVARSTPSPLFWYVQSPSPEQEEIPEGGVLHGIRWRGRAVWQKVSEAQAEGSVRVCFSWRSI